MKKLIALSLLLIVINVISNAQKRTFLRIYGMSGEKINRGYFAGTNDSALLVYKDTGTSAITYSSIGYIKTKRSLGHNMAISAAIAAVPLTVVGVASGENPTNENTFSGTLHDALTFTPAEGAAIGLITGTIVGAATGAIITAVRKSSTLHINGNINNWIAQRKILDQFPIGK